MSQLSLKALIRKFYRSLINRAGSESSGNDWGKSAIVFSPHQDDETLGCGGTIIRKKKAGADLQIVFMTDGCISHSHLISETELKSIRASEAIAASQRLGVEPNNVIFLDFRDGTLAENQELAIQNVVEIIQHYQPEEIFIPYYKDVISDHTATNQVVKSALKRCKVNPIVYEYPIWFWRHWPWTSLVGDRQEISAVLKRSLKSGLGLRLLNDFRCAVYIKDVLDLKRAALDEHKSQMTRLISDSSWRTLGDVSNGEFLDCFFQDYEVFHQYRLSEKY